MKECVGTGQKPVEKKIYSAILKSIANYSRDDYLKNIDFINRLRRGRMMRLRQCLSYTRLLETAIDGYSEDLLQDDSSIKSIISKYDEMEKPSKLKRLVNIVAHFQKKGEKVVIWANFIDFCSFYGKKRRTGAKMSEKY